MLGLVITGSSGLYESAMGDSYPRRGDRDYIQKKQKTYSMIPKSQRLKSWRKSTLWPTIASN
jgi:hypothetical protein